MRRLRDPSDRRRVVVTLTSKLEKTIVPLFEPLSRRMLARFEGYSGEQIELLRAFLIEGAREMRDEAAKLTTRSAR